MKGRGVKTNFLVTLHWLFFGEDKHLEFEVTLGVFNFTNTFDNLDITTDQNKEKINQLLGIHH